MESRVDGLVALVTGASRGIGLAITRELLDSGAAGVVITGRKIAALDRVVAEIDSKLILPVAGNVGDDEHATSAVQAALDEFGRCDILVNNAATNPVVGPLADIEMAAIDKIWQVNQRGPLLFARAAWTGWMAERGGAIVNIGSVGGSFPSPGCGAYSTAKAALHALTRQLAFEFAPDVRVNTVTAGVVKTGFSQGLWGDDPDRVIALHPLGRIGTPEDVARAVVFLASPSAAWISGVALPVDGGLSGASPWHPPEWSPLDAS